MLDKITKFATRIMFDTTKQNYNGKKRCYEES